MNLTGNSPFTSLFGNPPPEQEKTQAEIAPEIPFESAEKPEAEPESEGPERPNVPELEDFTGFGNETYVESDEPEPTQSFGGDDSWEPQTPEPQLPEASAIPEFSWKEPEQPTTGHEPETVAEEQNHVPYQEAPGGFSEIPGTQAPSALLSTEELPKQQQEPEQTPVVPENELPETRREKTPEPQLPEPSPTPLQPLPFPKQEEPIQKEKIPEKTPSKEKDLGLLELEICGNIAASISGNPAFSHLTADKVAFQAISVYRELQSQLNSRVSG
jgi:hypothetical protein